MILYSLTLNVCYSLFKLGIHIPRQFHNSLQIPLNTIGQSKPASQQIKFLEHQWRTPALSHLPNCQGKLVRMSAKQKSPSRLRRDEYRMSIYNSCKQILELQQKSEDLLMMEDQVSLLNETLFQKLDTIDEQQQELNHLKNKNMKKRTSLSFRK